jgi:UDP-glucose 4-epimerase
MATYLVTGGAGFIGSHLCEFLLSEDHVVRVIDDFSTGKRDNLSPKVKLFPGDAADPAVVGAAMAAVDGVFHLAAIASVVRSNEEWRATHLANQTATVTVLDEARKAGRVPVVYASSAAIYGDTQVLPVTENAAHLPLTAYGADKLGSELHGWIAYRVHRVPTAGLRFFNVFGPRQDPRSPYSGVISIFAAQALAQQRITIHGDGQQTRDFIYVRDVVHHLAAAMATLKARPRALICNVCSGQCVSMETLARTLTSMACWADPLIEFGPVRAGDIRHSVGDPRRAIAELGVQAGTTFRDGLAMTLAALVSGRSS